MPIKNLDTFKTRDVLKVGHQTFTFYNLKKLETKGLNTGCLPYSLKILLENLLRHEDGQNVSAKDIETLAGIDMKKQSEKEIAFTPARVILQDFTGVPCVVDLAAMRDAMVAMGGDPKKINPLLPAELVIDHSVQVDSFGLPESFDINSRLEYERNRERYVFLRWGQKAFRNFKVVPPETGIVHQVNLEYLARVVFDSPAPPLSEVAPLRGNLRGGGGELLAYPDTVVGTDSHTTMINGLGVLGWGVGGIEAEAAMLGQPINLLIPQVVGFKLFGKLTEGATATDLVLTVTQMLRKKGVVGKFVEFFGDGISALSLADRATLANMAPEYGATCGIFPIDAETIDYLRFSGRDKNRIDLVEAYAKAQGFFHTADSKDPEFTDTLELDLAKVVPAISGPKRPQDLVKLSDSKKAFQTALVDMASSSKGGAPVEKVDIVLDGQNVSLHNGSVVIAAITSCTNTSNPSVLMAAGLVAKKAVEKGLSIKPWVKSSLAPGSQVVTEYLRSAGLLTYLEKLKFNVVGYGCTTCIGNSGPLPEEVSEGIKKGNLVAVSVLSGNRNFEGRINPDVRANYLASPPLVVAYALAGRMDIDLTNEPLGENAKGEKIFLKNIWPTRREIQEAIQTHLKPEMYRKKYADVFKGDELWQKLPVPEGERFEWDEKSTYVRKPTFFDNLSKEPRGLKDIRSARVLVMLGDSVTTDHISPAGSIKKDSPAGLYLQSHGVKPADFNSYGARRGNHEVMMRGTFANIRLRNQLAPGTEGGVTRYLGNNEIMSIYDASIKYQKEGIALIVLAGKEYGSGSSRDWAAKGTYMLGVKTVIAESYERIHRSNLIGMGILPLQFLDGQNRASLGLTGEETFSINGLASTLKPFAKLKVQAKTPDGIDKSFEAMARIDTPVELEYYRHGGILQYVLRQLV